MVKIGKGQLNIPVPPAIGFKHDPDEAYEREYGTERLAEQRRRYEEERRCTCGSPWTNRWGARWKHKVGCPRAGKRF